MSFNVIGGIANGRRNGPRCEKGWFRFKDGPEGGRSRHRPGARPTANGEGVAADPRSRLESATRLVDDAGMGTRQGNRVSLRERVADEREMISGSLLQTERSFGLNRTIKRSSQSHFSNEKRKYFNVEL